MKLTDLNTDGGIGANCLLLEIGPYRILIDAGLHPKKAGHPALPALQRLSGHSLDFVVLTHCHLDHLGSLPLVARHHPEALILCSRPSAILAPRMLHNSINVMKRQREEDNIAEYPLYTRGEIDALEERMLPVQFERPVTFDERGEDITFTFYHAGHIAGAAGVRIDFRDRHIMLTGDVLFTLQRTLDGAQIPTNRIDTLVMETTRGATSRDPARSRESETASLLQFIRNVADRGGSLLLPVFALGRMQEVLKILHEAKAAGSLPSLPIYASGLGMALVDYFDAITRKTGLTRFQRRILTELRVQDVPYEFIPGRGVPKPGLFILSSGMMVENTPSYRAAAALLDNPRNAIAFCGYCDPDTPGGKLLQCQPGDLFTFEALDYIATLKAEVARFDLSAHADREELLEFALALQPRTLVLTHGDPPARLWFQESLAGLDGEIKIIDPVPLQLYHL